jgi:hypothetical protein
VIERETRVSSSSRKEDRMRLKRETDLVLLVGRDLGDELVPGPLDRGGDGSEDGRHTDGCVVLLRWVESEGGRQESWKSEATR